MDPDSFAYRLRGTIALLEAETQQGVEDWTTTIARLKITLAEEEANNPQPLAGATASYSDSLDSDDEYDLEAFD